MLGHSPQAEFVERRNCISCDLPQLVQLSQGSYSSGTACRLYCGRSVGRGPTALFANRHLGSRQVLGVRPDVPSPDFERGMERRRFTEWMSADAIKTFEARLGPAFDRTFHKAASHVMHILRIEKLTRSIRATNEAVRLLDFGCGFGRFLEACRNFGFNVCGVDRSVARRQEASLQVIPSLGEIEGLPKFHTITLFEVLEHLDNPSQILRQLGLHLLEGGLMILETPDCSGVTDIKTHSDYLKIHPLEHINAFTHDTLKSMAERCGYQAIPRGGGAQSLRT